MANCGRAWPLFIARDASFFSLVTVRQQQAFVRVGDLQPETHRRIMGGSSTMRVAMTHKKVECPSVEPQVEQGFGMWRPVGLRPSFFLIFSIASFYEAPAFQRRTRG
jgi:hypothetical protein